MKNDILRGLKRVVLMLSCIAIISCDSKSDELQCAGVMEKITLKNLLKENLEEEVVREGDDFRRGLFRQFMNEIKFESIIMTHKDEATGACDCEATIVFDLEEELRELIPNHMMWGYPKKIYNNPHVEVLIEYQLNHILGEGEGRFNVQTYLSDDLVSYAALYMNLMELWETTGE